MLKKAEKRREPKYEKKVKIEGTLDEVLKILIASPPPLKISIPKKIIKNKTDNNEETGK